ncbi:hypothetical protein BKA67DRAFT_349604 [Truncatella angustata]|uniref:PH domain-containing protein n=1 Tax=Truncatella angustata TaxID=152316 RepID=A0A9P8UHE3_9PEZI|nr:uncharacterized protein BKA67DRAFT_349604 [Truncatella angustata]KAH6652175.1 hypothetical protein BKA67DRAFT_349604 [Truncatella angustata]
MSWEEEPSGGPAAQAPKFSRYRSVRVKTASTIHSTTATDHNTHTVQDAPQSHSSDDTSTSTPDPARANSIARSMSRYRRHAGSVSGDNDATSKITAPQPSMPPVPAIPSMLRTNSSDHTNFSLSKNHNGEGPIAQGSYSPSSRPDRQSRRTERAHRELNRKAADYESQPSAEAERRRMADRDDRERRKQEQEDAAKYAARVAHNESESDRLLAKQKKRDLERLQVSLANNHQSGFKPPKSPKARSPVVEKFVALTKRRKSKEGLSPTSSTAGSVSGDGEYGRSQANLPKVPRLPVGIEVGGKGIVPQKDAPVSAVNHGDRIVSVQCRHHTFILPVTPETTPVDIVLATARNMTYDLEWSPQECVVLESYGPLGLERRIRNFECVRDVMNSWDRDTHNSLIVTKSDNLSKDRDLDIESVPETDENPQGVQLYMYHSNRPGKWNKRWITLTDNGQILCAKKPDASPLEKDTLSLCHLSDYDIYTPTEKETRKHIKPPKRRCFAIKSQHKPAMFLDTENYVQYFSMEDPGMASLFSEKVQSWRSWYLADRRPAARRISIPKMDDTPPRLPSVKHISGKSGNPASEGGNRLKSSVDDSPYKVGEFEPLIDMRRFDKRLSLFGEDLPSAAAAPSTSSKQPPSHRKKESKDSQPDGPLIDRIVSASDEAFTGNGLLGQNYNARKASVDQGAAHTRRFSKDFGDFGKEAFTDGPSLLSKQAEANAAPKGDVSWFPSALEHSQKHRETDNPRPNTSAGVITTRPPNGRSNSSSHPPPIPQQSRMRSDRPPISNPHLPPSSHPQPLSSHDPNPTNSRRQAPKPLVNLTTPTINEPPQWSSKKGHGVQAPEGMRHLVDLISVGAPKDKPSGLLEIPPRSAMRRPPTSSGSASTSPYRSGGSLSRTRSQSSGPPTSRPLIEDVPPVPNLPGMPLASSGGGRTMTMGAREKVEMDAMREAMKARERDFKERERDRGRARERGREREARNDYSSTGRVGTLKVV